MLRKLIYFYLEVIANTFNQANRGGLKENIVKQYSIADYTHIKNEKKNRKLITEVQLYKILQFYKRLDEFRI